MLLQGYSTHIVHQTAALRRHLYTVLYLKKQKLCIGGYMLHLHWFSLVYTYLPVASLIFYVSWYTIADS